MTNITVVIHRNVLAIWFPWVGQETAVPEIIPIKKHILLML